MPLQPPSQQRGNWIPWIIGISVGVLFIGGLGLGLWWNHHVHQLPAPENISVAEKHRETRDAFVEADTNANGATPTATESERADITAALDLLNNGLKAHDSTAVAAVFDGDALCDALEQQGALKGIDSSGRSGFRAGFTKGASGALLTNARSFIWESHQVKKLVIAPNHRDAVVYDLETHGTPPARFSAKVRWWMHRSGGQWKIWDVEALGQGFRMSTIIASGMSSGGPVENSPLLAAAPILKALIPDMQAQDWPAMQGDLEQFDTISLPPQLDALRKTFWGILHLRQEKYPEALKDCDALEATGQDVPLLHQLRAQAYNHLGQYDKAFDSCLKWEDALGPDADMYYEKGTALAHLNRKNEAAKAFEQSMDEDPDAGGSLAELSKVLPADEKSEIARRFALSQAPGVVFTHAMPVLLRARDLAGMQQLIDAYALRPESASDQWLTYYHAELFILGKQYKEGEAMLKPLVPFASAKGKALFATEYYYAATLANDAVSAYQSATQPRSAYRELARRVYAAGKYTTLAKLTSLHQAKFPRDFWCYFYQGCGLESAKDYAAAETAYATAMSLADDASMEEIRSRRVYCQYSAGHGLAAYQNVEPRDKTFLQLARLFSNNGQGDDLAKLVEARRADAPYDTTLPLWDADAKFQTRQYQDAVNVLNTIHPQAGTDSFKWTNLYIRSQIRLKNFDAARAEANRATYAHNWHIVLVETTAGHVDPATTAMNALWDQDPDEEADRLYSDPDIGPAIKSPAFAEWRSTHPMPTTQATTQP